MKDANAAMTLLDKWPEKVPAMNGFRIYYLCVTGAMLYQLSYQSLNFFQVIFSAVSWLHPHLVLLFHN